MTRLLPTVLVGLVPFAPLGVARAAEEPPTLPDPLRTASGERVADRAAWEERRGEILELFRAHVYGRAPSAPPAVGAEVVEEAEDALGGKAVRRQVRLHLGEAEGAPSLDLLVYLPAGAGAAPAFLALNFGGNHTVHPDPAILLPRGWVRDDPDGGVVANRATEAGRGSRASRWPVEAIVGRGYALATAYYGDVDPDYDDGFENGVHALGWGAEPVPPPAERWGSIAAWAWGLSRALDYLEDDPGVDGDRVAVMGHSRLGKAALVAGAEDERFALVISNDSGCGGAALSRRRVGETVKAINDRFPHWFADAFTRYDENEDALPVDQHMLLALVAPRPLYVASASEDAWADPEGEFLSALHASAVYEMLGHRGLGARSFPEPGTRIRGGRVGYHLRRGAHDVTDFDWQAYLDFADRHFGGR